MKKRAFFTPSAETVTQLTRQWVFGSRDMATDEVSFEIDSRQSSAFPALEEVTISPVTSVRFRPQGFEIEGLRKSTQSLARLVVDLSVEPPLATYSEISQD